jgi:hypothetical protein
MSVSSVSSMASGSAAAMLQKAARPEAVEPRRVGPDRDGDADDRVGSGSVPKTLVKGSGETIGLMVDTHA